MSRLTDRVPLRTLLVGTMLLLVLAGLVVSGAAVASVMRAQLVDRVDVQLREAADGWARRVPGMPAPGTPVPDRAARGLPPSLFYVEERTSAGTAVRSVDERGARPEVPSSPQTGTPITVPGTAGGDWRVLVLPSEHGTTILGIPLNREVDRTITLLVVVSTVVGAAVLLLVGAAGWYLVTRALRPLGEVRAAAGEIAAGDLSRRLPPRPTGTEVGDLTASLDEMVDSLRGALAAAHASEDRTRRFAADAGHELRTPLTSIRGFAELHRMGAMPDAEAALGRIEAESLRMSEIVEDLLALAHLDAERPLERAPVDLAGVVSDAVVAVRATAPGRDVRLDVRAVPVVSGDAGRLRRVVSNLVVNAVRHTPDDAHVWVAVDQEDGDAVVTVRDDGPGMDAADAARAFERFHRADASRTRVDGGGSGLGLSIVEGLVRAHGGTVRLDTAPGEGATFTVRLPAA